MSEEKKKKDKKVKKKKLTKEQREKKYKKVAYAAGEKGIEELLNELKDKTLEWEEISSNQDIQMYKRDIEGFKFPKLKLVSMIPMASPQEVYDLSWKLEGRKKWDNQVKAIEIMKTFPVENENEELTVVHFSMKPPMRTMSARFQVDATLLRRTNDGKIIIGRQTVDDSKIGIDTSNIKGKKGITKPSGVLYTPITRKQWIKYAKKSKTTRTIKEGEDPDEIVATKMESIIFPDIGKNPVKMLAKMMLKMMSKFMPKGFVTMVDYITTEYQEEKKKKSKKSEKKKKKKPKKEK
ncbi:phosphatidylcholine transfer protein [Anaeramoeba flamelloides]|uniref:Phosphatidylcholine transfer protein n=1 Tax=Anaeramoeba flamelloides TaxID=1746091 RepID=A0AAV7Z7L8_9EUKA|nr:phosphatidylcholine transfer protein [Anaeramoeba flamelloides]